MCFFIIPKYSVIFVVENKRINQKLFKHFLITY